MIKVTTDNLNGNVWSYEDGWYYQTNNGKEVSRLSSKNFPNPFDVWTGKIKKSSEAAGRSLTTEERDRLKPRQYIFDIWKHKEDNNA